MKELVEFIVTSLVDHPEQVRVREVGGRNTTLELSVAGADMGRVIGKSGRVINAIRALAQVVAAQEGKSVDVEVMEKGSR